MSEPVQLRLPFDDTTLPAEPDVPASLDALLDQMPAEATPLPDEVRLVIACLRDYATVLVAQQGLRPVSQDVRAAYEALTGFPVSETALAACVRMLAVRLESPPLVDVG